jgi:RsiW-degrading membrane proteinase PrsW (M82 family)
MNNQKTLLIVALAVVLGFVAIETADLILPMVEAKGCENGAGGSTAFNASKGRCFGHGP